MNGKLIQVVIAASILFLGAAWANPPATINVHGSLVGPDGMPLMGTRAYVVRFFDAAVDGTQLGGDLTGTVELSPEGLFNLPVVLPAEALAVPEVWYELGIDSDVTPDDNADDDVFPERIRVHSVPFALEAGDVTHLDAIRIGGGTVDNTEFGYLDGLLQPLQTLLNAKADDVDLTAHTDNIANPHDVTKAQVGLGNVDDTADLNKPVSTAVQAALDAKAGDADLTVHEGDTANPHVVTAVQVGLGNVDNTADAAKPVSTATQTALDAKAGDADLTAHEGDTANPHVVTAAQVGLDNVDNTTDAAKPVSTATQAALDAKANAADLTVHEGDTANPHVVTKAQVGLANVDDTADANKPVSTAAQAAIDLKANAADVTTSQAAQDAIIDGKFSRTGTAHIIVETTDNAATNAANLQAAYTAAKALMPNGVSLSATNRAVVLVAPGSYDLGAGQLMLDREFVDLVGLSTARDNQYIHRNNIVLVQTAIDVHIENLLFHYTGISDTLCVYYPDATWDTTHTGSSPNTVIRNCEFRSSKLSMRNGVEFAGTYQDCAGNHQSFGGNATGSTSGIASGTFINCTAGDWSFGRLQASGTFINCTGDNLSFGAYGTADGKFIACTGGSNSFGGSGTGTASGTFTDCTGNDASFGGLGGVASGTFTDCTGNRWAFGGNGGTAAGGKFYHCIGGASSFTTTGSPTVLYCIRNGAAYP